ncbi:2-amino-3,7-dideoxy-D-threo-hept-6-ulosonate synthase [Amycolatopsis sp. NPDC021455]|uniref:2-amino-3,7-dideoxy-D-threo-hept-6-ulosonate synthase n=1 Tax=Amycolatopsis sp. NPDC021455 TaxID=3154901 RepID=UPI0033D0EF60
MVLDTDYSGKRLRARRMSRPGSQNCFLVPLDHSVADGPLDLPGGLAGFVALAGAAGADGVIVHKGRVRFLTPEALGGLALVVHLNGATRFAADVHERTLFTDVEEAARLGADAVSVHVNMGSRTEAAQLADLGRVAGECGRFGLPLLAMVYPRGPGVPDPLDPALVAHAASLAADLGADLVKVPYTGSPDTMAEIVAGCPIPVLAAGGAAIGDDDKLAEMIAGVMSSGARGVAMGRNAFLSADPRQTIRRIADVVHRIP